jgi:sugar/nucleoside kinase (ribokinase family)
MPSTSAALEHIGEHEGPLTIKQLETYRKVAKAAESASVANPADMRMAGKMVDWIDDYMDNLGANDIVKGNAKEAVTALGEARDAWSRYRKADTIDSLIDRAQVRSGQFSGSGLENALRTEFRQLALNKKKMGGFTAEEQAAIRKVAMGGPMDNVMRMAGKLAPTGAVSAAISGAGGFMAGGPIGAMAVPAAGGLSRYLATRGTIGNANAAQLLMRRGPNPPPPTILSEPGALNLAPLLLTGSMKDDKAATAAFLARKLQEAQ